MQSEHFFCPAEPKSFIKKEKTSEIYDIILPIEAFVEHDDAHVVEVEGDGHTLVAKELLPEGKVGLQIVKDKNRIGVSVEEDVGIGSIEIDKVEGGRGEAVCPLGRGNSCLKAGLGDGGAAQDAGTTRMSVVGNAKEQAGKLDGTQPQTTDPLGMQQVELAIGIIRPTLVDNIGYEVESEG